MDTNDMFTTILINSIAANSKLDALAQTILDESQEHEYADNLKEFWRSDLLRLHDKNSGLFDDDALDVLIKLFD